MKIAALTLGIALLSSQLFAAESKTKTGPRSRATRGSVSGNALGAKTGSSPAGVQPQEPLPPTLITTSLGGRDLEFLMTALENGRVQAWLGQTAKNKAESEQIRAIGDALHATQTEENKVISDLAKRKGLNVADSGTPVQGSKLASDLPKTTGAKMDKILIEQICEASQKAVSVYESGLRSRDEEIRKLSEQMLPVAKEKLQLASKVAGVSQQPASQPNFRGVPDTPRVP